MSLREIRISRDLTQRELAQRSGVNFRSLQDYEQGHKKLISANGDILMRLSTVLGCSIEDLLIDQVNGADILPGNKLSVEQIQAERFYCEKFRTYGRWICSHGKIATVFYYNGIRYEIPFAAIFTPSMLPVLKDASIMQMEAKIEELLLEKNGFESW